MYVFIKIRNINFVRTFIRFKLAISYYKNNFKMIRNWISKKTENDNFYYELTQKNSKDLISLVSFIFNVPTELLTQYHEEIVKNDNLIKEIENTLKKDPQLADIKVGFGRREAWYLIIRVLKPKVVIETGVHQGVGTCVITSALKKNTEEGYPGEYIGIDIDKSAGKLFHEPLTNYGKIIYSDSIEALYKFRGEIDVFINDSDHRSDYEAEEYMVIKDKLSSSGIILGDNSHTNSVLREFSIQSKRSFVLLGKNLLITGIRGLELVFRYPTNLIYNL